MKEEERKKNTKNDNDINWYSVIKILTNAGVKFFDKFDATVVIKASIQYEAELNSHDEKYEDFYTSFAALAADCIASCANTFFKKEIPMVWKACQVLLRFLVSKLTKQYSQSEESNFSSVFTTTQLMLAIWSLCSGQSIFFALEKIELTRIWEETKIPPSVEHQLGCKKCKEAQNSSKKAKKSNKKIPRKMFIEHNIRTVLDIKTEINVFSLSSQNSKNLKKNSRNINKSQADLDCKDKLHTFREVLERIIYQGQSLDIVLEENKNIFKLMQQEKTSEPRKTLLHHAVIADNLKAVKTLLLNEEDSNAKDQYTNSPLHYAESKKIAKLLIKHNADVNAKNDRGKSVLVTSYYSNNVEVLRYLLRNPYIKTDYLQKICYIKTESKNSELFGEIIHNEDCW